MTNTTSTLPPRILRMIDAFCEYANAADRLDPNDSPDLRLDRSYFDDMTPDYFSYEMIDSNRFLTRTLDDCNAIKFSCYIECDIELIAFFDADDRMTNLAISTDISPYEILNF